MSGVESSGVGRIYIKAGSAEIDLSGSAREVNDAWLNITKQDTWQSTLSRIRVARQEAIESAREVAIKKAYRSAVLLSGASLTPAASRGRVT
tara:strand:+ start:61 stop:336 length:276 start_codon:yes stop_codon:yes gene_type:complete